MTHVKRENLDGKPEANKVYEVETLHSGSAKIRDYIVLWYFRNSHPFRIKYKDQIMTINPKKTSLRDAHRSAVKDRWGNVEHYFYSFRFIPDGWKLEQGQLPI